MGKDVKPLFDAVNYSGVGVHPSAPLGPHKPIASALDNLVRDAFLRGVKAGLEAAAEWADWLGAQYSVATERGVLIKPASSGIRAIDPATVKEPSDG